ncbi:DNA replication/repair protein RecF [candidate division KSB1 bacterium]|nr:DNA replication/repair protein RecF [candidate division KSB1 bacterium]
MRLQSLELVNFRNYDTVTIHFSPGCNILFGENAQGKTNIIEAIFYLCFSRSFRTQADKEVVHFERLFSRVNGNFVLDRKIEQQVTFRWTPTEGKTILVVEKRLPRFSELIGKFPVVLLSPEDYKITSGAPVERRHLFDMFLSQVSPEYLEALQKYTRILKQRNKILSEAGVTGNLNTMALEPWNQNLIQAGCFLIRFRQAFATEFNPLLAQIYSSLNQTNESLNFSYKPSFKVPDLTQLAAEFQAILQQQFRFERARGITLIGPHRDDFNFQILGHDLRNYGSRGQHKSVLVALKLAEFHYLKEKRQETPILLLDDLFSDLDSFRERKILDYVQPLGQTFITTTKKVSLIHPGLESKEYLVQAGNVLDAH